MKFRPVHEYAPNDAPEAVDEVVAEAAPPLSEARRKLAKLLTERSEAQSESQRARDAIGRLQRAQTIVAPFEAELAQLSAAESEAYAPLVRPGRRRSPTPAPDCERREALTRKIAEAHASARAAASAIPSKEAEFTRASNRAAAIKGAVDATIARDRFGGSRAGIRGNRHREGELGGDDCARRSWARDRVEGRRGDPHRSGLAIASAFYSALGALEKVRVLAMANPAPWNADVSEWLRPGGTTWRPIPAAKLGVA